MVDELDMKEPVDLVGYGVQWQEHGGGVFPYFTWRWNGMRYYAPANLITSEFVYSDEFLRVTANPGQGKGGSTFGDSGSPALLAGTNKILGVTSWVHNWNCAGVTYYNRIDIQEILDWIRGYIGP